MVVKTGISLPNWLFAEIEAKRGKTNRSEFIAEKIVKGLRK